MKSAIRLSVPHREQSDEGDCVPTCVAMVLDYEKIAIPYERVLQILKTTQHGTVASKIRDLEKIGVHVIYKKGTLDELREHLSNNHPPIAFVGTSELPYWNSDEKHAVVVVGFDENYVYVNDPAFPNSPIPVSIGDFDLAWLEFDELYAVLTRRS